MKRYQASLIPTGIKIAFVGIVIFLVFQMWMVPAMACGREGSILGVVFCRGPWARADLALYQANNNLVANYWGMDVYAQLVVWPLFALWAVWQILVQRSRSIEIGGRQMVYRDGFINPTAETFNASQIASVLVRNTVFTNLFGIGNLEIAPTATGKRLFVPMIEDANSAANDIKSLAV